MGPCLLLNEINPSRLRTTGAETWVGLKPVGPTKIGVVGLKPLNPDGEGPEGSGEKRPSVYGPELVQLKP